MGQPVARSANAGRRSFPPDCWGLGLPRNFWNYAYNFVSFEWIRKGIIMWNKLLSITSACHWWVTFNYFYSKIRKSGQKRDQWWKGDKVAYGLMSKMFRDRHSKNGTVPGKTGQTVTLDITRVASLGNNIIYDVTHGDLAICPSYMHCMLY